MGPDTTKYMNFDELSPLPQPQTFATQINCVRGLFSLMMLRSCLMQLFKDFILQFHTYYTVLCHSGISFCLIMYSIFTAIHTTYTNTHDSNALQLLVNGRMSDTGPFGSNQQRKSLPTKSLLTVSSSLLLSIWTQAQIDFSP